MLFLEWRLKSVAQLMRPRKELKCRKFSGEQIPLNALIGVLRQIVSAPHSEPQSGCARFMGHYRPEFDRQESKRDYSAA